MKMNVFDKQRSQTMRVAALAAVVILATGPSAFAALPKIACRTGSPYGAFQYADTGKPFYPEGNVINVLDPNEPHYHFQFNEGAYDEVESEAALAWMETQGYNVARVWIDCSSRTSNYSIAGPYSRNVATLYPGYMDNLIDFLKRATDHRIYVIVANQWFPINTYYVSIFQDGQLPHVTGWNKYFYTPGGREVKRAYLGQFAAEIAAADGGDLVNTILSFEVWNEICSMTNVEPFSLSSGTIETADGFFDMGDAASRQSCHDIGLGQFVIACARAIRQVIPDALCAASVFTNRAVGHAGFNGLLPIDTSDRRWPARIYWFPPVSDISYIDIHTYPTSSGYSLAAELESLEWSSIDKTQKPFFVSEFGAYKGWWPDVGDAATMLADVRSDLYDNYGFQGACLYTFDSVIGPDINYWNCRDDNGAINAVLAPRVRWRLYDFDGSTLDGWTTTNMSHVSVGDGHLTATFARNPASLTSPASLGIDTKFVRTVVVRVKNASNANGIDLYWTTDADPAWDETKAIHLSQSPYSSSYVEHVFELWDIPEWSGTVTQIMVVPGRLWGEGVLAGTAHIDYIHARDGFAGDEAAPVQVRVGWLPVLLALLVIATAAASQTRRRNENGREHA